MDDNNIDFRILIIEDNPGDFALTEDFLDEQFKAPRLTHAWDFSEAKKVLASSGCEFDVVLMDLSLPDKHGEDLIVDILALCGKTPVVVLTGYSDIPFGVKSLSLGIADYILKDELTSLVLYKSIIYSVERKRNMLAMKESEKRYSELFHLSPLPMFVFDISNRQILNVNKSAIEHYGYSRTEFLTMRINDLAPAEDIRLLRQQMQEEGSENLLALPGSCRHQLKNGELIDVEVRASGITYKGKNARAILVSDVTERLSYIKEIEQQNYTLKEISWIQSHVVRAPLARLMGLLQIFQDCTDPREKINVVDYLLCSANELDATIRDITDKIQINDDKKNTCTSQFICNKQD